MVSRLIRMSEAIHATHDLKTFFKKRPDYWDFTWFDRCNFAPSTKEAINSGGLGEILGNMGSAILHHRHFSGKSHIFVQARRK